MHLTLLLQPVLDSICCSQDCQEKKLDLGDVSCSESSYSAWGQGRTFSYMQILTRQIACSHASRHGRHKIEYKAQQKSE